MNGGDTILTDLTPAALSDAIEENEIAYLLYRCAVAGWEVRVEPDVTWFRSGEPHRGRNGVLHTRFTPETAETRIAATLAHFQPRRLPLTWWGGPSRRPHDLGDRLVRHDLLDHGLDPGLAADLTWLDLDAQPPAGLRIERVRDDETARRWLATTRAVAEQPPLPEPPHLAHFAPRTYDEDDPLQLWLATLEGAPVATSQALFAAGVVGVYNVGTVSQARRRGIGAAMTLTALRAGRERGYRAGVLGATAMGLPVYQRLGFRIYNQLSLHTWAP